MKITFRSKIKDQYKKLNTIQQIIDSHSSWGVDDNYKVACEIYEHKEGIEIITQWSGFQYFISNEKDEDGYFDVLYVGAFIGFISQELVPDFIDIKIDYIQSTIIEYNEGERRILPIPEYNFKQFDLIWRMVRDLHFENNEEKVAEALIEGIMYEKQYNLLEGVCNATSDIANKLELLSEIERYDKITIINPETGVLYHGRYLPKNMNFERFEHVVVNTIKARCKTSELEEGTRSFVKNGKTGEGMYSYEIDNLPNILHTKGAGLPFVVINKEDGKDRFGNRTEHVSLLENTGE